MKKLKIWRDEEDLQIWITVYTLSITIFALILSSLVNFFLVIILAVIFILSTEISKIRLKVVKR